MDKRDKQGEGAPPPPRPSPGTLGAVLYSRKAGPIVAEAEWVELVHGAAAGDQGALHALYRRAHRMVFTLAVRITCNRESAEEVTLDVFHDLWRRAGGYDPANGTVLGWIMNQARSRSIDRVRFEHRAKRLDPLPGGEEERLADDPGDLLELRQRGAQLRAALATLGTDERRAIECAFFAGLTHAEIAQRSNEPLGTIKTRIRSGLRKLRQALGREKEEA